MTYNGLEALLDHIKFNTEEGNISLKIEILNLCLDGTNKGLNNMLFWRFAQWEGAMEYPELISLFEMRNSIYSKSQLETYDAFIRSTIDDFEERGRKLEGDFYKLLNNDTTHTFFKEKTNELSNVLKKDAKALYKDLNNLVGDAIFEEIRYDLNPILGIYIAELYNLMQNEIGNLFDKRMFINACHFQTIDDIKLLVNIISLAKYYDVLDDMKLKIATDVEARQFNNLYDLHEMLLNRNPKFAPINQALVTVETKDAKSYNLEWINNTKKMIGEICSTADNNNSIDLSNLYVIINGKEKFKGEKDILKSEECETGKQKMYC
jgi:ribosome-associated toxin RatA of RatAB toxin-antitoxin module